MSDKSTKSAIQLAKRAPLSRLHLTVTVLCVLRWGVASVEATDRHWTGSVSGNWSDQNNWNPVGLPQSGDALIIDGGAHTTMTNDMASLAVNELSFPTTTDYTLNGNSVTFTGGGFPGIFLYSDGSATVAINLPVVFPAGGYVQAETTVPDFTDNIGNLSLNGSISVNSGQLLLFANGNNYQSIAAGIGHLYVSGTISGSGDVYASSENDGSPDGFVEFDAPLGSLFTGTLYLFSFGNSRIIFNSAGGAVVTGSLAVTNGLPAYLFLNRPDQIGHSAVVTVAYGSQLLPSGNDATIGSLVLTNVSSDALPSILDTGSTTWTLQNGVTSWVDNSLVFPAVKGKLALATGGRAFSINGTGYFGLAMQAQLSGAGGLVKSGNAALLLETNNTFSGQVFVTQGTLDVRNNNALGSTAGATTLSSSGVLLLRGVTITGETLNSQGNQVLSLDTTGSLLSTVGTCNWLGPIVLSSSLLVLADSLALTGPISGASGMELQNNNVRLASAGADNTYTGATLVHCTLAEFDNLSHRAFSGPLVVGGGNFGPCEARWLTDNQGPVGSVTLYLNGAVNLNNFNDGVANLTFNGGLVETGSGQLTVNQNITSNPTNATALITGNLSIATGDSAFFNIAEGAADPDLEVDASISGAPTKITKQGLGKLVFAGANSFTGLADVAQGILEVNNGSALGSVASPNVLTVETNATLRLNGSGSTAKPMVINGTGSTGANGAIEAPANSSFTLSGNITLGSPSTISVGASGGLALNGVITGTGPFTKTDAGSLSFGGSSANNYLGDTIVAAGALNLSKSSSAVAVPGNLVLGPVSSGGPTAIAALFGAGEIGGDTVTVDGNSLLNLNNNNQTLNQLNLNDGGGVQTGVGTLGFSSDGVVTVGSLSFFGSRVGASISGNIGLPANGNVTFIVGLFDAIHFPPPTGFELDVSASIPKPVEIAMFAPAGITKNGLGRMHLSANNTYRGGTFINTGILQMDGSQPLSPVFVDGGTLSGTGTVGLLYPQASSAVVSPGASPGILTCSNFNAGASGPGTLQIELNGTTPGSGYDQLNVHGTVNLSGITLNASLNYSSSINDQFVIINNDGSDAVTGTFNGLAQNASLSIGGELFLISYTGGSGNDVVLTRLTTPPRPALNIQAVPPNSVRLLWPTNDPTYTLQSSTNLATTSWATVVPPPVILGTNYIVTNTTSGIQYSYRLVKP